MKEWLNSAKGKIKEQKDKICTRATFFRIGVLACLIISVWHGVHLFTTTQGSTFLGVNVDILIAGTIDLGLWFLIDAMISTRKKGETAFSYTILAGIILLCTLSFVANYTYNQHYYSVDSFTGVEYLNRQGITLLQSSPPLIIIFMSIVGEVFVRPNVEEAQDYQTVLENKYMRRVHKLEARLKAQQREREILRQYSIQEEQDNQILVQPVKFSFGWFKVYSAPIQQIAPPQVDNPKTEETLQKISIAVLHLEQRIETTIEEKFNTLSMPTLQIEERKTIVTEKETSIPENAVIESITLLDATPEKPAKRARTSSTTRKRAKATDKPTASTNATDRDTDKIPTLNGIPLDLVLD